MAAWQFWSAYFIDAARRNGPSVGRFILAVAIVLVIVGVSRANRTGEGVAVAVAVSPGTLIVGMIGAALAWAMAASLRDTGRGEDK